MELGMEDTKAEIAGESGRVGGRGGVAGGGVAAARWIVRRAGRVRRVGVGATVRMMGFEQG